MRRHLYLPVELGSRELAPRLLTAAIAAERGFEVLLGYQHYLYDKAPALPAGVYLSKGSNNIFLNRSSKLRQHGHAFTVCEEESFGFVMEAGPITFNARDLATKCDLYFALGHDEVAYLRRRFGDALPIALTGNARVDLLRPRMKALYEREVQEIKQKYGKFILLNTNFGLINSFDTPDPRTHFQNWVDSGVFPTDNLQENAAKFNEFVVWENQNFAGMRQLMKRLMRTEQSVVLRPHPTENAGTWHKLVQKIGATNIQVVERTPHIPFMLASDLMIHPGCTTGIEALILDVPTISMRMGPSPVHDFYLCNRTNVVATSVDQAMRLVTEHCGGGDVITGSRPRLMTVLNEYLEDMTADVLTADKIVDAIEDFMSRRTFQEDARALDAVAWNDVTPANDYKRQKFGIEADRIRDTLAGFQRILGRFGDVSVTTAGDMMYRVSRTVAPGAA